MSMVAQEDWEAAEVSLEPAGRAVGPDREVSAAKAVTSRSSPGKLTRMGGRVQTELTGRLDEFRILGGMETPGTSER
jgi:hypothetical protein